MDKKHREIYMNIGNGSLTSAIIGLNMVATEADKVQMPNTLAATVDGKFSVVNT
jgi:hypothetical protein